MPPGTYCSWFVFRAFVVNRSTRPRAASVKKHLKICQLAEAAHPPAMKFVHALGIVSTFVAPGECVFWKLLNEVILEKASEAADPNPLGLFAPIGSVRGQPLSRDERMKKVMAAAAKNERGDSVASHGFFDLFQATYG